jgi:hypothetical protein
MDIDINTIRAAILDQRVWAEEEYLRQPLVQAILAQRPGAEAQLRAQWRVGAEDSVTVVQSLLQGSRSSVAE